MASKVINTILNLRDNMSGGLIKAAKNTKGVSKEMVSATRSVVAFKNKSVSAISEVMKKTVKWGAAAAGAAATGLGAMAVKAGVVADDLNTLSKQSGFSTEDIQKWKYAADVVDVSVDDITGAAKKMKKNMNSTSSDVTDAWKTIGVSTRDSKGAFRDSTTVFYEALQGLSGIKNETQRDVLAMTLFGKSADSLAGIVDDGGAALRGLGKQAKDAGLILSQDALDGANAFNDVIDTMKAKASASFTKAGSALATKMLPAMERLEPLAERVMNGAVSLLTEKVGLLADKFSQWEADGTIDALADKFTNGLGKAVDTATQAFQWAREHGDSLVSGLKLLAGAIIALKFMKLSMDTVKVTHDFFLFSKTVGVLTKKVIVNSANWIHNTVEMGLNKAGLVAHAVATKAAAAGTTVLTGAQKLLNLAFVQTPIGWVVLGVTALIAAGVLLYKNWDKVKAAASSLWESIKATFGGIRDSIVGAFVAAKAKVAGFFSWIDTKVSGIPVIGSVYKGVKSAGSWVANRISGHATGTSYFSGGLTRVNERGGEIMRLPGGTQIIPHDVSRRMAGGLTIMVPVTVQGNVIGNEAYAEQLGNIVAQRILRALRNS